VRRADFPELAKALAEDPSLIVVDARRNNEWRDGHVDGARHVPLHEFLAQLGQVKAWSDAAQHAGGDPTVWVSCGSGFRAMVAASLLARIGVPVVAVDDDFAMASSAGLTIVTEKHGDTFGAAYTD